MGEPRQCPGCGRVWSQRDQTTHGAGGRADPPVARCPEWGREIRGDAPCPVGDDEDAQEQPSGPSQNMDKKAGEGEENDDSKEQAKRTRRAKRRAETEPISMDWPPIFCFVLASTGETPSKAKPRKVLMPPA